MISVARYVFLVSIPSLKGTDDYQLRLGQFEFQNDWMEREMMLCTLRLVAFNSKFKLVTGHPLDMTGNLEEI